MVVQLSNSFEYARVISDEAGISCDTIDLNINETKLTGYVKAQERSMCTLENMNRARGLFSLCSDIGIEFFKYSQARFQAVGKCATSIFLELGWSGLVNHSKRCFINYVCGCTCINHYFNCHSIDLNTSFLHSCCALFMPKYIDVVIVTAAIAVLLIWFC